MKKNNLLAVVLMLTSGFACIAHAGKEGGGGSSVVCRDKAGKVQYAKLLDVWEGETREPIGYGLNVGYYEYDEYLSKSKADPINVSSKAYASHLLSRLNDDIEIFDKKEAIRDSEEIQLRMDFSNSPMIPSNDVGNIGETNSPDFDPKWVNTGKLKNVTCGIEYAARYEETNGGVTLFVNNEIYKKFNFISRVALDLHEPIYRVLRKNGYKDSHFARHVVARMISGGSNWFQPSTNIGRYIREQDAKKSIKNCDLYPYVEGKSLNELEKLARSSNTVAKAFTYFEDVEDGGGYSDAGVYIQQYRRNRYLQLVSGVVSADPKLTLMLIEFSKDREGYYTPNLPISDEPPQAPSLFCLGVVKTQIRSTLYGGATVLFEPNIKVPEGKSNKVYHDLSVMPHWAFNPKKSTRWILECGK